MNTKLLSVIAFLLCITGLQAQQDLELGLSIGALNYQGDFSESPVSIEQTHFSIGFGAHQIITPKMSIRLSALFGKISGDYNNISTTRLWTFERELTEFTLMGEWHPWGKKRWNDKAELNNKLSPYIALGTGLVFGEHQINIPEEDALRFQEETNTDGFVVLPIALGARLFLSDSFTISGEFSTRYTLSDTLDGVSNNGNPDANDWYVYGGVSLRYVITSF